MQVHDPLDTKIIQDSMRRGRSAATSVDNLAAVFPNAASGGLVAGCQRICLLSRQGTPCVFNPITQYGLYKGKDPAYLF